MSSLLEQAIIDADALKEAALKNAENSVLEKYSQEVKSAIDTLLEQDMGMGIAPPGQDMGMDIAPTGVDTSFVDEIPLAHENPNISGPEDDELIEIDFDDLRAKLASEEEEGQGPDASELISPEETAEEIFGGEMPAQPGMEMAPVPQMAPMAPEAAAPPPPLEEKVQISDDLIDALAEELAVDVTARLGGWAPLASGETAEHAEEMALEEEAAEAQSEEVTDEKEKYLKLYETNISELRSEVGGLRSLLGEAKDQLNILILENAKLHYQNKALNSASLNERQKERIVEAVRNAGSIEETKMLFETLQGVVGDRKVRRLESLREAVSKPTTSMLLAANASNRNINSSMTSDPTMDRMLRLAGLKK
jgi:hypothetical protein